MTMMNCRLANLLLSILGLTVVMSPGVIGQRDENGIFIDFGGNGFTDEYGNEWLPDTRTPGLQFSGGRFIKSSAQIAGARGSEVLYKSERFHNSFSSKSMEINVGGMKPGLYEVRLHFAEIFVNSVNKRIFDVWVQEIEVYNDLDIFALVGENTALTINAATRVTEDEDEIRIRLDRVRQNPKINGVEIRPIIEVEEFQPIYINCGGEGYRDSQGRLWEGDNYFDERTTSKWSAQKSQAIEKTDDAELYRTERFATQDLKYEVPVPSGTYKVVLHMAEIYFVRAGSRGKRVFDVFIQDSMLEEGVDIYEKAGPYTATQVEVPAFVDNGILSISLQPQKNPNGTPKLGQYPKLSAIEIHEIKEVYQWNNYGRLGLTLVVMNALNERWSSIFDEAVKSWSGEGVPIGPDARSLKLLTVEVPHDPDCTAVPGRIKVCNGDYGDTKWVGLNTVTLQDGFIKNSVARMNDFYLDRSNSDQQMYAMCHEMGHACGLPHTDEDYFNEDSEIGDCLDYTLRPENNKKPGPFNFQLLEQLYGTLNPNRNLRSLQSGDDTPEEVKELIDDVVAAIETTSCQNYAATSSSGLQVTQLENNDVEESCVVDMPGGFSVQIRKLLAKHWDLQY